MTRLIRRLRSSEVSWSTGSGDQRKSGNIMFGFKRRRSNQLTSYGEAIATGSRPKPSQVEDFVEFVASAHSWYKHLPLWPPGKPFTFFLSSIAGMELRQDKDGNFTAHERTEDSLRFHYTWMTTADYRRRFGMLDYTVKAGKKFQVHRPDGSCEVISNSNTVPIPKDVAEAGTVAVTAVVHPLSSQLGLFYRSHDPAEVRWPDATGGEKAAQQIQRIVAENRAAELKGQRIQGVGIHPGLEEVFAPERVRIKQNMRDAIHRMLDLAFNSSAYH